LALFFVASCFRLSAEQRSRRFLVIVLSLSLVDGDPPLDGFNLAPKFLRNDLDRFTLCVQIQRTLLTVAVCPASASIRTCLPV
jgi:hypothetical protein